MARLSGTRPGEISSNSDLRLAEGVEHDEDDGRAVVRVIQR